MSTVHENNNRPVILSCCSRTPLLTTSLALGLGLASSAHAQPDPHGQGQPAATVIVTGSRIGESNLDRISTPVVDTPQAISSVSVEVLEDRAIANLNDALRSIPGISIGAGETSFQGNNASLRGFTTRNDMFLDNIRDYGYYYRDTFDDASVDVLKGPSSVLFGRGATGGVIHRSSKKPIEETFGEADIRLGLDDTRRITADLNLADAAGEHSALRITAMYHESAVEERDHGRSERWGVAPKLAFGLGTNTRLLLSYFHQEENNIPDYGIPWFPGRRDDPGRPAAVERSNYYGFTNDFLDTDVNIVTAKFDHEFSEALHWRSHLRYSHNERAFRYSEAIIPAQTPAGTELATISVARNLFQGFSTDEFLQHQTEIEAGFTLAGIKHVVIAGVEWSQEEPTPVYITNTNVPATSLIDPDNPFYDSGADSFVRLRAKSRSEALGAFALDTLEIGTQWRAILGLRWDSFRTQYDSRSFDQAGTPTAVTALDRTDRNLSYRTALVYKPAQAGSIYAAYANSFNPSGEGIESLISSGRALAQANLNLDPETSFSFEVGTKWNLFGERALLAASIFRIEKDNVRVPDPATPGFNSLGGRQRVDGAEVEFNGEIMPGWDLSASYSFLDSETLESSPSGPIVGEPLTLTARHQGVLSTTYAVSDALDIGFTVLSVSKRLGQNTPSSYLTAPGFTIADLNAKYRYSDTLTISLAVNNLTDKQYYEQLHPVHVIPGAGRTALVSVRLGF